jgi:hypothetical protein
MQQMPGRKPSRGKNVLESTQAPLAETNQERSVLRIEHFRSVVLKELKRSLLLTVQRSGAHPFRHDPWW